MKVKAILGENASGVGGVIYDNAQVVNFVYVIEQKELANNEEKQAVKNQTDIQNGVIGRSDSYIPSKLPYVDNGTSAGEDLFSKFGDQGLIYMNYNAGGRITDDIQDYYRYGLTTVPQSGYINAISIYRKEIWYKHGTDPKHPELEEEKNYHLVTNRSNNGTIYDFNVGNNRYYKYLFRFVYSSPINGNRDIMASEGFNEIIIPVKIGWNGWVLTELHEVENIDKRTYGDRKVYHTSLKDVWKFKYNISPGDYQQNVSKTKQDTLSTFPKFIHGPMNSMSGQVSCLLGRDVLPFDWQTVSYSYGKDDNGQWGWQQAFVGPNNEDYYIDDQGIPKKLNSTYGGLFEKPPRNSGGYKEELWPDIDYANRTSNKQLDLLHRWQDFCYSGNPKLLKDALGHRYIVQIHDVSSHVEEMWEKRPITISFSWTEIEEADKCQILEEES